VLRDLARVRQATDKYHDVNVALADGFIETPDCVSSPGGPMGQHEPGQPPHYDLHVWIWQANPSGMFAVFNPNVKCQ
jgi:hypothetical protein